MAKVRVAILGCGGMAGGHARRFAANPDVELVALCDVDEPRVAAFIQRNIADYQPRPAIFTDPAAMYATARPDAVSIVTPHTLHFEHGQQALAAGCHVLMEKPMVTDSTQAHALAKEVAASGKVFCIGYNTPCTPEFKYLRELIRSGELGKLELVSGWLVQNWKRGTSGSWRQDPALSGGGQMYDSGAHLFNSLVWLVEQPVAQVQAFVDNCDTPVDINGTANIKFADGTLATITIGGNCRDAGAGLTLSFVDGRVEVDGWGGSWIRIFKGGQVKYPAISGTADSPMDNFVDAILGRAPAQTSPINGVIQSELMDAIYESARTGTVVTVQSQA
ncbi:MAG: Gfo/Idh/MocA family oxidoreductase [Fimbriimonadaceae bacterium]|nr:Gfo/Idh/MocA family oxidoreductase [Fimbriimonadaceae bacterium]